MIVRCTNFRGMEYASGWESFSRLWTKEENSTLLSMDRTCGLGLTYKLKETGRKGFQAWTQNSWLPSYSHLLTRPEIVAFVACFQGSEFCPYWLGLGQKVSEPWVGVWYWALSLDRSTISALRSIISSSRYESVDEEPHNICIWMKVYINVSLR